MIVVIDVTGREGQLLAVHSNKEKLSWTKGKHAEILGRHLDRLSRLESIDKVGVMTGPGSFTGIRIGLSMALGLRSAKGIPLYALSKFELAWHLLKGQKVKGIAFPAMRGSCYTQQAPHLPVQLTRTKTASEAGNQLFSSGWYGKGQDLPRAVSELPDLCHHFYELIQKKEIQPTEQPVPLYVRPPDATVGIPLIQRLLNKQ
ncbi:MAG: hypothetical protein CSA81_13015 [Acidobacteria bacterium]|nr:MAG: hypothetical protein CSA81_13015 [Acidobacteriota bacterium]PIE89139.1 MAG: hypothetical protein CR997_12755 [Acidobacteriota bacterium]